MAARKRKYQTETTREKIKTSQLVNRLQDYIDGKVEMTAGQIRATECLLSKTLPALTSADITAHVEETRTYEEIRAELIRDKGEPMALFMLGEITQGQLVTILQGQQVKQLDNMPNDCLSRSSNEVDNGMDDVPISHSLAPQPDKANLN